MSVIQKQPKLLSVQNDTLTVNWLTEILLVKYSQTYVM
jgi:hypothetical protein